MILMGHRVPEMTADVGADAAIDGHLLGVSRVGDVKLCRNMTTVS